MLLGDGGIGLQKGLFLRGLGLGNCTDWLRLSVLNPARRDLRCLSQFLITGDTVCSFIFFRLQYSDSNHSANLFPPLLVLHAPQPNDIGLRCRGAALPNELFGAKLEKGP